MHLLFTHLAIIKSLIKGKISHWKRCIEKSIYFPWTGILQSLKSINIAILKNNCYRVIFQSAVTNYRFARLLKKDSITVIFVNFQKFSKRSFSPETLLTPSSKTRYLGNYLIYGGHFIHLETTTKNASIEVCPKLRSPWGVPRVTWLKLMLNVFEKHSSIEIDSKNIHSNICKLETLAANKNDWNDLTRDMMLSLTLNIQWYWCWFNHQCQMPHTSDCQRP